MSASILNFATIPASLVGSSIYKNKQAREYVSHDMLRSFIQNEMGIKTAYKDHPKYAYIAELYSNEQAQIEAYERLYDTDKNHINVSYYLPKHGYGRVEPPGGLSLSKLHRPTRHALCKDKYVDIDIECAQPVFFAQLGIAKGIKCPSLFYYSKNCKQVRADVMDYYNISKDKAKQLLIALCFGGKFYDWIIENGLADRPPMTMVEVMERELLEIGKIIYDANPSMIKALIDADTENTKNYAEDEEKLFRSAVSAWAQTIERKVQETAIIFLVKQKHFTLEDIVPCQDGFMILKELYYDGLLDDITIAIAKLGISVRWAIKEFDEAITIPPYDPIKGINSYYICSNDVEASEIVFNQIKDRLIISNASVGGMRLFMKHNNIWADEPSLITSLIECAIFKSNIYSGIHPKTKKLIPYAQNTPGMRRIYASLMASLINKPKNDNFYELTRTTTINRFCFQDGVLDMEAKQFYRWDNLPYTIYSTVCIPRKFEPYYLNHDQSIIDDIYNTVMLPLFGSDTDRALHFLSRAMGGNNTDKVFGTYVGNRDCGKGVIYGALQSAFGYKYVCSFDLNSLIAKSSKLGEFGSPKDNEWLLPLEYARIAISQETPDIKSKTAIDGKKLKNIASGGDELHAKRNYDRFITVFRIMATLLIMGNNSITTNPPDAMENCISFMGLKQFKSQEEIDDKISHIKSLYSIEDETDENIIKCRLDKMNDNIRLYQDTVHPRDPALKFKMATDEYANAMVMLIYNYWKPNAISPVIDATTEDNNTDSNQNIPDIIAFSSVLNIVAPNIAPENQVPISITEVYSALKNIQPDRKKAKKVLDKLGAIQKRWKCKILYPHLRDKDVFINVELKIIHSGDSAED